jgi:hypothetical protein
MKARYSILSLMEVIALVGVLITVDRLNVRLYRSIWYVPAVVVAPAVAGALLGLRWRASRSIRASVTSSSSLAGAVAFVNTIVAVPMTEPPRSIGDCLSLAVAGLEIAVVAALIGGLIALLVTAPWSFPWRFR